MHGGLLRDWVCTTTWGLPWELHQYLKDLPKKADLAVFLKQVKDIYKTGFLELKAETLQIGARVESLETCHTETTSALQTIQARLE